MGKATKQQIPVLVARLVEFQEEFSELSSDDARFMIQKTKEAIRLAVEAITNRPRGNVKDTDCLRYLKTISVGPTSGRRLIVNEKELFSSWIDPPFHISVRELTKKASPKGKREVEIYELFQDKTFKQFFTSLNRPLEELVLTQDEVIQICENNRDDLRQKGWRNFFLVKKDNEKPATEDNIFVVLVGVSFDSLSVSFREFGDAFVWVGRRLPLVFLPATERLVA